MHMKSETMRELLNCSHAYIYSESQNRSWIVWLIDFKKKEAFVRVNVSDNKELSR